MARFIPSLQDIQTDRVKPTDGEWCLLQELQKLDDSCEVFFQPICNGDFPDIVILKEPCSIFIIEVKDWDLMHYEYIKPDKQRGFKERMYVIKGEKRYPITSPLEQVIKYKNSLSQAYSYELSKLIILYKLHNWAKSSVETIVDPYSVLKAYVFFYNRTLQEIKTKFVGHSYDVGFIGKDRINDFIKYVNSLNKPFPSLLKAFTEVRARLNLSLELINQRTPYILSKEQEDAIDFKAFTQRKIKGKAGSGKTLVLAQAAIKLNEKTEDTILILCFNITLKNYIRDMISRQSVQKVSSNKYHIMHFHEFIFSLLRENNVSEEEFLPKTIIKTTIKNGIEEKYEDKENFSEVFERVLKSLKHFHEKLPSYSVVLIDEVQDFEYSWLQFIKEHILVKDGYYVLFGDEKQNIYDKELDKDKKVKTNITGAWKTLAESRRFRGALSNLAFEYQKEFFQSKYEIEKAEQKEFIFYTENITVKETISTDIVLECIIELTHIHKLNINDITILSEDINLIQQVDYEIRKRGINTITTFEELELHDEIVRNVQGRHLTLPYKNRYIDYGCEYLRKSKKSGFNLNSGGLKISTIHSFKGWESHAVILLVDAKSFYHNKECTYVGITRAREFLYILSDSQEFTTFLKRTLNLL